MANRLLAITKILSFSCASYKLWVKIFLPVPSLEVQTIFPLYTLTVLIKIRSTNLLVPTQIRSTNLLVELFGTGDGVFIRGNGGDSLPRGDFDDDFCTEGNVQS